MSLFHILFNAQKATGFNPSADGVLGLELDATVSEAPEYKANATMSPVESGAKITDHVNLEPLILSIEGIVTATPAMPLGSLRSLISPNAVADAHKKLKDILETRESFTFVGGLDVYNNMVLTSYTPVRTAKNSNALEFRATMQQITVVSTQKIPSDNLGDEGKGAAEQVNRGHQATIEAPPKLSESTGSILFQWYGQ